MTTTSYIAAKRERYRRIFWGTLIASVLVWMALIILNASHFGGGLSNKQSVWAEFGEYVGGILGPLFAFAAFLILLLTFQDQSLKIEEDRVQLDQERMRQVRQDFEGTFFNLLRRFSEVVSDMRYEFKILEPDPTTRIPTKIITAEGRNAMRVMFVQFRKVAEQTHRKPGASINEHYEQLYETFYNAQQHELGIYFRTLYHIFKFIDTSALSPNEMAQYGSIARAQLSAYELGMIFYNGLWGEGLEGFKPLIEKYGILKHAKKEVVIQESDLSDRKLYKETAFLGYKKRLQVWNGVEPVIPYD